MNYGTQSNSIPDWIEARDANTHPRLNWKTYLNGLSMNEFVAIRRARKESNAQIVSDILSVASFNGLEITERIIFLVKKNVGARIAEVMIANNAIKNEV